VLISSQEQRLCALRDALTGQVFQGADGTLYPLRECLGEGSQGWVFRATWNGSVDVVVKVLRPESASPDSLARFQREAQVLRMLSQQARPNPHLVRFFDHAYAEVRVGETGDCCTLPFTVLEYVDGPTLEAVLDRAQGKGLGVDRARRILRHVCLALRDVHAQNVVHRDLKPSNILIDATGGRETAKVTDFGLAKLMEGGTRATTFAGATVGYAPPEQFEYGNKRVGRHTDVFSTGAIFYELIAGAPAFPFNAATNPVFGLRQVLEEARPAFSHVPERLPRELQERPDVVAALDAELARAFALEPGDRQASIMDLFEGIDRALASLGGATSMPRAGPHGIVVRPSTTPSSLRQPEMISGAPTLLAEPSGEFPPPHVRVSNHDLSSEAAGGRHMPWRILTTGSVPGRFGSIGVAPDGQSALGAGPDGLARWEGGRWTTIQAPAGLDGRRLRMVAWSAKGDALLAGEGSLVATLSPTGGFFTTRFEGKGLVFHAGFIDANGAMTFAGARIVDGRTTGVIAQIVARPGGTLAPRVLEIADSGPFYGVIRLDDAIVACGERGSLVLLQAAGAPKRVQVCDATLFALAPLGDGTAAAAGGGGFIFRVWPTLDTQLEAIQTTRDLFTLARSPDGLVWTGGAQRRVLRRDAGGWTRVGAYAGPDGIAVRALYAGESHIAAFCDDGSVLEGARA
jgi:serine/threonine protein kinase